MYSVGWDGVTGIVFKPTGNNISVISCQFNNISVFKPTGNNISVISCQFNNISGISWWSVLLVE